MLETMKTKLDQPLEENICSTKVESLKNLKHVPTTTLYFNCTNQNQQIMLRMAKLKSKRINILSHHKLRKNLKINLLYNNNSQDQIDNPILSSIQEEKLKKNLMILKLPVKGLQNIAKK